MAKWKRIGLIVLGILAVVIVGLHIKAKPAQPHPFFTQFERYPLVIAHAGSKLYPTDTMYALERYAAMGVDVLEMDVHTTQDGVIVLLHDDSIDRTADGSGLIWEMTFAEAQQLDFGYWWTQDDGASYPLRGQGVTVTALEDVFTAFPGYPMIIEIKQESPSMTAPFCEMLRAYHMAEKVIIASFSDVVMAEFRELCPEVATSAGTEEVRKFVILNFMLLSGIITPEYEVMQVPESRDGIPVVTKLFLWAAARQNLQVQIWTVNDPADMERFIAMGLDGIMTDRTDLLLEILDR